MKLFNISTFQINKWNNYSFCLMPGNLNKESILQESMIKKGVSRFYGDVITLLRLNFINNNVR